MDEPNAPESDVDATLATTVRAFLRDAETVLEEYEQGYMDADVALSLLESHVEDLRNDIER